MVSDVQNKSINSVKTINLNNLRLLVQEALDGAEDARSLAAAGVGLRFTNDYHDHAEDRDVIEDIENSEGGRWGHIRTARLQLEARMNSPAHLELANSGIGPEAKADSATGLTVPISPTRIEIQAALQQKLNSSESRIAALQRALDQARNNVFATAQDARDAHQQLADLRNSALAGEKAEQLCRSLATQLRQAEVELEEMRELRNTNASLEAECSRLRPLAEAASNLEAALRVQAVVRHTFAPEYASLALNAQGSLDLPDAIAAVWVPVPGSPVDTTLQQHMPQLGAYVQFTQNLVRAQQDALLRLRDRLSECRAQQQQAVKTEELQRAQRVAQAETDRSRDLLMVGLKTRVAQLEQALNRALAVPAVLQRVRAALAVFPGGAAALCAAVRADGPQERGGYSTTSRTGTSANLVTNARIVVAAARHGSAPALASVTPPLLTAPLTAADRQALDAIPDEELPLLVSRGLQLHAMAAARLPAAEHAAQQTAERLRALAKKYNEQLQRIRDLRSSADSAQEREARLTAALTQATELLDEQQLFAVDLEARLARVKNRTPEPQPLEQGSQLNLSPQIDGMSPVARHSPQRPVAPVPMPSFSGEETFEDNGRRGQGMAQQEDIAVRLSRTMTAIRGMRES